MKNYVDLEEYGIEFKNLLSGPAPLGRILNYIIRTGDGVLKHKNGNRNTHLENNIGDAWCTEFMIGLGIITAGIQILDKQEYKLHLTKTGKRIYDYLKTYQREPNFPESPRIKELQIFIETNGLDDLLLIIEPIFRKTPVFKNLLIFLETNDSPTDIIKIKRNDFINNIFAETQMYYENKKYNFESRTPTGQNRVPSLIQICEFLNYCESKNGEIYFSVDSLNNGNKHDIVLFDISDENFANELSKEEKIIKRLAQEYGEQGTTISISEVRLPTVQKIFKERLVREYGCKCMMCGIINEELLIASHIQDSAISNINQKADNNNGLLLCSQHDKLFDRHLITFEFSTGALLISNKLNEKDIKKLNLDKKFILPEYLMTPERMEYLIFHNEEFYKKQNS